jgi:hypothetical protein
LHDRKRAAKPELRLRCFPSRNAANVHWALLNGQRRELRWVVLGRLGLLWLGETTHLLDETQNVAGFASPVFELVQTSHDARP